MKLFVTTISVVNTNGGYVRSYSDFSKMDSDNADWHCLNEINAQNHDTDLDNEFVSDLKYEFQRQFVNLNWPTPEAFVEWANSVPHLHAFITRTEIEV